MNLKRFGVSVEEDLLSALDSFVKRHNFPNRSQAIRQLIRNNLIEKKWKENKKVAGCLVLVYDHHKRELMNKSIDIQHEYQNIVLSVQHVHLDHHNCLETIALFGKAKKLEELSDRLIALKGIKHGKLVTSGT
ncbi:MAG: nickel-responsive transcriptional regulator NikR [Candidatus Omnitrophica bacterium]|nr:nickel-responsive transcriptional regulator NikR [Candidatus Omnitrophota bacterium]